MSDLPQRIVPNVWCNRNAEEAGRFYAEALPDTRTEVEARYPTEGLLDFQQAFAGEPLTVTVEIAGTRITLVNAGDEFRPTPALSFTLNFDPLRFGGATPRASRRPATRSTRRGRRWPTVAPCGWRSASIRSRSATAGSRTGTA